MKTKTLLLILVALVAFSSCKEEVDFKMDKELYTRAFIKRFCIPDDNHNFNMAVASKVTVKSQTPRDVKILANVEGETYMFADYTDVSGVTDIEFDVPKCVNNVIVYTDDIRVPVELGGIADLDQDPLEMMKNAAEAEARSRSRAYDEFTFMPYYPNIDGDGSVTPVSQDVFTVARDYSFWNRITGWELLHYIDKEYMESEDLTGGNFALWDEQDMCVAYWNKHNTDDVYEFGVVYTEKTEHDYANDNLICVPYYRTDEVKGTSTVKKLNMMDSWLYSGAEITIDFDNKTQKVTDAEWTPGKGFSYFFKTFYNDQALCNEIKEHLEYQHLLPVPSEWYGGSTEYGLEPYDEENPLPFWRSWDNFVYAWMQDNLTEEERSHFSEFIPLKEYFGFFYMLFPTDNAMPRIAKVEDGTSNNKYRITYYTPTYFKNSTGYVPAMPTEMYQIEKNGVYRMDVIRIDQKIKYNKYYGFYARNVTTGKIVTSLSGERINAHYRFLCNKGTTIGQQAVYQFDLNEDGAFDDMVVVATNRVVEPEDTHFKSYSWIVVAEDLGSTDDWDFNDLVVEVNYVSKNSVNKQEIRVRPLAAGGILPIYLMYTDPLEDVGTHVVGTELHKWLGRPLDIYNTGDTMDKDAYNATTVTINYDVALHDGKRFSLAEYNNKIWEGTNMGGLWVMVDPKNRYGSIIPSQPDVYRFDRIFDDAKTWTEINLINTSARDDFGTDNNIPMMMCVGGEWEWPSERSLISESYPSWVDWLKDSSVQWYGSAAKTDDEESSPHRDMVTKRW